jgi:hypothetical protein
MRSVSISRHYGVSVDDILFPACSCRCTKKSIDSDPGQKLLNIPERDGRRQAGKFHRPPLSGMLAA